MVERDGVCREIQVGWWFGVQTESLVVTPALRHRTSPTDHKRRDFSQPRLRASAAGFLVQSVSSSSKPALLAASSMHSFTESGKIKRTGLSLSVGIARDSHPSPLASLTFPILYHHMTRPLRFHVFLCPPARIVQCLFQNEREMLPAFCSSALPA